MSKQVILRFKSQEAKARFIGGLIDGWGEGAPFGVKWKSGRTLRDGRCQIPATEADEIDVDVLEDEDM